MFRVVALRQSDWIALASSKLQLLIKTLYGGQFSLSTQFGYLRGENARLYCDKQEVFIFIGYQALKREVIITAEGGWAGGG